MNKLLKRNWVTIAFVFLNMAMLGIIQSERGPILPFIKSDYNLNYENISIILTVCSVGMLLGILIGGRICERFSYKKGLIFATFIMLVSLASLIIEGSFKSLVINLFFMYIGLGCIDIALNSLGGRIFVTNTAILMSLTHFFYGIGSAVGSKYAGFMLNKRISWRYIYISILAIYAISFFLILIAKFPNTNQKKSPNNISFIELIKDGRVWLSFGTIGFCVIFDYGIANWLIIYLRDSQSLDSNTSSSYLALYFTLYALGRLFGGVVAEKFGYVKTLFICMLATIALFILGIINTNTLIFAVIGLFESVCFPLFLSIIIKEFKENAPTVINIIVPLNSILFMISSVALGVIMEKLGVVTGFYTIGVFATIAPIFLLYLKRKLKH